MSIHTLFIYLIASFLLGFILEEIKKKRSSMLDIVLISNIYLLLLAGLFTTYHITDNNDNIFFIVLFQILESIIYQSIILELPLSGKQEYPYQTEIITLISSYLINILFINQVNNVFLDIEEFKLFIWLVIIVYLFNFSKKNSFFKQIPKEKKKLFYQDQDYIVMQYAKFKNQYYYLIHLKNKNLTFVFYAMMIYENYHTPNILRKIDELKYKLDHHPRKFGIMQIYSKNILSDEESIKIAISKLDNIYRKIYFNKNKSMFKVIQEYYHKKNIKEVWEIYKQILLFEKK